MSNQQLATPVRASEVITFVVVAFAVEQIAQGTIQHLWGSWDQLSRLDIISVVVLSIVLVVTAVRFYHGNAVYLSRRYAAWHHRQLSPGGVVAIPLAHFWDTLAHLFQYLCLVAAGFFMGADPSLAHVAIAVVVLFAFDAVWTLSATPTSRVRSQMIDGSDAAPLWKWCVTNVITAGLLIVVLLAAGRHPLTEGGDQWLPFAVAGILAFNTWVDYKLNYDHYFEAPLAPEWVSARQANESMQHLLQCLELSASLHSRPDRTPARDWLQEKLPLVFTFMLREESRSDLFQRTRGHLHVGIYFESGGVLFPAFRWAPGFELKNRTFAMGRSFIGFTYSALMKRRESAQIFDSYKDSRVDTSEAHPTDSKYYKSSVMANIFWPPSAKETEPIGILVVTSDEEAYFTRTVHEPLVVGLCSQVSTLLGHAYGRELTKAALSEQLTTDFQAIPIVINNKS